MATLLFLAVNIFSDQRSEARKKILDTLAVNQVIQGTVKNITNYGVFIDIGGVDGLAPYY